MQGGKRVVSVGSWELAMGDFSLSGVELVGLSGKGQEFSGMKVAPTAGWFSADASRPGVCHWGRAWVGLRGGRTYRPAASACSFRPHSCPRT